MVEIPKIPDDFIFCSKCGQQNPGSNDNCQHCDAVLHKPAPPAPPAGDDGPMGGLIPYRNAQALWAYYLGIFSLIPCLGIPLGISAFILGILGLKYSKTHPQAKGKGHALTGIILGGLCGLANIVLLTLAIIGAMIG